MKNLKKLLGLMVASVFTFAAVSTVSAAAVDITKADGTKDTTGTKISLINTAIQNEKSAVIELPADWGNSTDSDAALTIGGTVDQVITIRLNGHELDLDAQNITVAAKSTLNIVGTGTIKSSNATAIFAVTGGGNLNVTNGVTINGSAAAGKVVTLSGAATSSNKTVITFSKDTVVETKGLGIDVSDASIYSTVNVAGEWTVDAGSVVTVSRSATGAKVSHPAEVNIMSGGEYTTNANAANVTISGYAKVNIKGGTFNNESSNVIELGNKGILNITGGNFTTEAADHYALNVSAVASTDSDAKQVQFTISAGTFKSGEDSNDEDGKLLPAINLSSEKILNANAGHVTGGVFFTNVGNYLLSTSASDGQIPVATVSNTLTKGATATSASGKVTVKSGAPADTEQKPEDEKPGTGDNQPDENPKTFDAIGSLVALAVSSLGVVGTATKKLFR